MIYTIGHRDNYLKAIAKTGTIWKLGKHEPGEDYPDGYPGGYAFQSIEDAQRRIDEAYPEHGFAIFGLSATWEDTEPSKDGWWNNLLTDAEIVVLEKEKTL